MTQEEFENLKEGDVLTVSVTSFSFSKSKEYIVKKDEIGYYIINNFETNCYILKLNYISFNLKQPTTVEEVINDQWWKDCKAGDLIKCHAEPSKNPDMHKSCKPGGIAFKPNSIFTINSISFPDKDAIIFVKENTGKGVIHNSCSPIKINLPREGKLKCDDEDNWRFIEQALINKGYLPHNIATGKVIGIAWNETSYWPVIMFNHSKKQEVTIEDCIVYKTKPQQQTNKVINNNLNLNQDGRIKENTIKINRQIPTITVGIRQTGTIISGRASEAAISSRCISDTACIIRC